MRRPLDARGLTLPEVTVVTVIATIVMAGIVAFYMSSQATWMDASTQVLTQREAAIVAKALTERTRLSASVNVTYVGGDTLHAQVAFTPPGALSADWYLWWSPTDSLVHFGSDPGTDDRGPLVRSIVETFRVQSDSALVRLTELRMRSALGSRIALTTSAEILNR